APVQDGRVARCQRCHTPLIFPRGQAVARVVALSLTILILMIAAVFFPFLTLEAGGFRNSATLIDAATAFDEGWLIPLSGLVAAFILILPAIRTGALLYALMPLLAARPPARYAAMAMRIANRIRPWAMAEIFVVGMVVALVKIVELASVTPGPAFWAFCGLVAITVLKDTYMCRWSIWNSLAPPR
ncbi:MAG: paraquat-inducible protein A, partial [Pseudomonadota bacterium]